MPKTIQCDTCHNLSEQTEWCDLCEEDVCFFCCENTNDVLKHKQCGSIVALIEED